MIRAIIKILLSLAIYTFVKDELSLQSFRSISDSPHKRYKRDAVVSNVPECADILKNKNGSAVDAAIAILICEGASSPISLGIGGRFLMTIYDALSGEVATTYRGNARGMSIAVPGELMGYWEAHQKYGRVPWKELFEPSVELCRIGVTSKEYNDLRLKFLEKEIIADPNLAEFLITNIFAAVSVSIISISYLHLYY